MKDKNSKKNAGTILILSLWSLGLLTVFSTQMGLNVRQKITLLSRLEARDKLYFLTESGIKKAIALLRADAENKEEQWTPQSKAFLHNNEADLCNIALSQGVTEVSYGDLIGGKVESLKKCGMMDEESKINLNKADPATLKRLIREISGLSEEGATDVADAIFDWREFGQSQLVGFASDEYYENLEFPYPPKNADYEIIDELLLVKGVDEELLKALGDYLTVYGEGKININTASYPVLSALGLDRELVDKILKVRRGPDGLEASLDDHIFVNTYDITSEIQNSVELEESEIKLLDDFNNQGRWVTQSAYYSIKSEGLLSKTSEKKTIVCVYKVDENKIVYWKED